jgi:hypothetical protein
MKTRVVIILVVQLIFACSPLTRQAAALERGHNTEQLRNRGRELSPNYLNHKGGLRVKERQHLRLHGNGPTLARLQQDDLLKELLPPSDLRYASNHLTVKINKSQKYVYNTNDQGSGLLEELLAERPIP